MQPLRIVAILLVFGLGGIAACDLYWDPTPDPHHTHGPTPPDAGVIGDAYVNDSYHPPDGYPWYPDAYLFDAGTNCGGACPDAAYVPDACSGH
jgi:hypothetical protein